MSNDRPHRPAETAGAPTEPVSHPPGSPRGREPVDVPLQSGDRIGFYQIEERLGAGGMGVVYRARDTQLGRTVALKLLSPQLGREQDLLARFRNEAQIQARLTGRNIVTLHTIVQSAAGLALVMEYVEGRTLARQLARHGALAIGQALRIFDHALRGVAQAHRLGIVHGDLKPGNIFLAGDGEIKLMDFGLAQLVEGRHPVSSQSLLGTLHYMPPEQIEGQRADFRSDLYALGVSLYEAVTGQVPFKAEDPTTLLQAHLHQTPPPPSSLNPGIPQKLEAVIEKAMARVPEQRYQTADEMRSAIQSLRRDLRPGGVPPEWKTGWEGFRDRTKQPPRAPATAPFTYGHSRVSDRKPVGAPGARTGTTRKRRIAPRLFFLLTLGLVLMLVYFGLLEPGDLNPQSWWARLTGAIR